MCDVYNDWHRIMGIDTRAEKEDESVWKPVAVETVTNKLRT